jgi:hypothetical protein
MVAHTYCNSDYEFGNSKARLYEQCCNCLLESWENQKEAKKRISRFSALKNVEIKVQLLSSLAFYMFEHNLQRIKETDLVLLWTCDPNERLHYLGRAKEVVDEMLEQSGILERVANGSLQFYHRSFFEYFTALHMAADTMFEYEQYPRLLNEQNILFFYLSMKQELATVESFIKRNPDYNDLIIDLLVEKQMLNYEIVTNMVIENMLPKIDCSSTIQLQSIGYIAQRYVCVQSVIKLALCRKLTTECSEIARVNIINSLMIFGDVGFITKILKTHINSISMARLVQYSGDWIDNFARVIIELDLNLERKMEFVENLARAYKFKALYNIYTKNTRLLRRLASIGFLMMTRELRVFRWLENKEFINSVGERTHKKAVELMTEFEWAGDELDTQEQKCLFLLLHICRQAIDCELPVNSTLINNRVAYLLSYIISKKNESINTALIEIENIKVDSVSEFSYHWNRRKHSLRLFNGGIIIIPASVLNAINIAIFVALFAIQLMLYIFAWSTSFGLSLQGYDIGYITLSDFSVLQFNASYFLFLAFLLFINQFVSTIIKNKLDYNNVSKLMHILKCAMLIIVYNHLVYSIEFRLLVATALAIITLVEVLKHRQSYPSFNEPQYSRIIAYLAN